MILVIGEILFDLFPDYNRMGGAPFNFAFHLKQLGFDTRFISRVGDDGLGKEILETVASSGFNVEDIQVDPLHPTGVVHVSMDEDGSHSFDIKADAAYDHIQILPENLPAPRLFYFGTLIQRTQIGRAAVHTCLDHLPWDTLRFCDINLRPNCHTPEIISQSIARSQVLKLSIEELDFLVPDQGPPPAHRAKTLLALPGSQSGPDRIILTKGAQGSTLVSATQITNAPPPCPVTGKGADTVGAGDAYAAVFAAGMLSSLSPRKTLALAQDFAGHICTLQGALPKDLHIYKDFKSRLIHEK